MAQSNPQRASGRPASLRYGVAALSVAAAVTFAVLMRKYLHTEPFASSFLCAIMFAAWVGGAGPDLLAIVLAVLGFIYFAAAPGDFYGIASTEIPRIVLFTIAGFFLVALSAAQRAAMNSLRRARDDREAAVHELAALNKALQAENVERKRAESALRRSEAHLAEAQRLSHTGSFGLGVASGEAVWSKEMYQILEVDQVAKPTLDLVIQRTHPDERELVRNELENVALSDQDYDYAHRLLMPNGAIKDLNVRARRMKYESGEEEIICALMDVTASKQAQEALQTAQADLAHVARAVAFAEMSASIAHEVNQPLASIVANGEAGLRWLNREAPEIGETLAAIRRIVSDANRASGVVGRIRELARKVHPEVIELSINEVIDDAITLVKRETVSQRIAVQLRLAPRLPSVRGDRIQLQQVIINLVINAVEAMATVVDRARVVTIRTKRQDPDQVLVTVEDVGIGLEPESLDRLFSPFYTTKPGGMGIGLSICRSIVEAHEGRVWASRNNGPGMTFQFTIPAYRDSPNAPAPSRSAERA
jgi:C4-dicarboxylate-specific signal transduction histidine kinase